MAVVYVRVEMLRQVRDELRIKSVHARKRESALFKFFEGKRAGTRVYVYAVIIGRVLGSQMRARAKSMFSL